LTIIFKLSAQKAKLLQPLAPVYQTPLLQQRIKPVKVESPTATLNYDQEMQETIPTTTVYSQESKLKRIIRRRKF
jgi:hypothetical protein